MSLDELKKQFILDDDALKERLERVIAKALEHCRIDKNGQVLIIDSGLAAKDQIKLTLAARVLAAQLDDQIPAAVTVTEISKYTGLPANQVRARGTEAIKDKFAEAPAAGVYRAIPKKIEPFLDSISKPDVKKRSE
jgi:hypothetical protein